MDKEQRLRLARAAEDILVEMDRLSNALHIAGILWLPSAIDRAVNLMEYVEGELKNGE